MARAALTRFIRRLVDVLRRRPQTTVTPEMLDVAEKQRQQALDQPSRLIDGLIGTVFVIHERKIGESLREL